MVRRYFVRNTGSLDFLRKGIFTTTLISASTEKKESVKRYPQDSGNPPSR